MRRLAQCVPRGYACVSSHERRELVTNSRDARGQSSSFIYNENRGFCAREMYVKCDRRMWFDVPLNDVNAPRNFVFGVSHYEIQLHSTHTKRFTCFKTCCELWKIQNFRRSFYIKYFLSYLLLYIFKSKIKL